SWGYPWPPLQPCPGTWGNNSLPFCGSAHRRWQISVLARVSESAASFRRAVAPVALECLQFYSECDGARDSLICPRTNTGKIELHRDFSVLVSGHRKSVPHDNATVFAITRRRKRRMPASIQNSSDYPIFGRGNS